MSSSISKYRGIISNYAIVDPETCTIDYAENIKDAVSIAKEMKYGDDPNHVEKVGIFKTVLFNEI